MPISLTLKPPQEGQDKFFLWNMVILPIVAAGAYMYDGYFSISRDKNHHYAGLFSTIVAVFTYLRYCVPIESHKMLGLYYILLCILNEAGTIGYLIGYILNNDTYNTVIYVLWGVLELIFTGCLIYYRVIHRCHPTFQLENEHLFKIISRLEVILAIYIPFFYNPNNASITLTKQSIAFFILFDFFSESYNRFESLWIKSIFNIFVCTVTICVATEWAYSCGHEAADDIVSLMFEFISACLCDILIIFQFNPYHFKSEDISKIARAALDFQEKNATTLENPGTDIPTSETNLYTIEVREEPTLTKVVSKHSVIDLEL